jgi:hypothetical protein
MTRQDVNTARRVIVGLIHEHMPTAAVASGWVSAVDPAAWVRKVSDLYPYVERPADLGLTALTRWLEARGVEAGPAFVKALRIEWIMTALAVESWRSKSVTFAEVRS